MIELTDTPLRALLHAPPAARGLLCFLHGHDEGPPTPLVEGMTRHGPLAVAAEASSGFAIVAPQMPARGDLWFQHADDVADVVDAALRAARLPPDSVCLTGFSYGGNGVWDLALACTVEWRALWAVDPTRVPSSDPGLPVWLSSGAISRNDDAEYREALRLVELNTAAGARLPDRVIEDAGLDHVGTAARAYADRRPYDWMLRYVDG